MANTARCLPVGLFLLFHLLGNVSPEASAPSSPSSEEPPVLLVVSYDAFRTEYLRRNSTLFMNELRRNGTTAEYLRNVFPTKTFPNHHSIATGVYPNQHGIMGNGLYDHGRGKLNYSYELFHFDDELVPIWVSFYLSVRSILIRACVMISFFLF